MSDDIVQVTNYLDLPEAIRLRTDIFSNSSPSASPLFNRDELRELKLYNGNIIRSDSLCLINKVYTYVLFKAYLSTNSGIVESFSIVKMSYDMAICKFDKAALPQCFFDDFTEASNFYDKLIHENSMHFAAMPKIDESTLKSISSKLLKNSNDYYIQNPLLNLEKIVRHHQLDDFIDDYLLSSDKVFIKDKEYHKSVLLEPLDFNHSFQLSIISSTNIKMISKTISVASRPPENISGSFISLIDAFINNYASQLSKLKGTVLQIAPSRAMHQDSAYLFDRNYSLNTDKFYTDLFTNNNPYLYNFSFPALSKSIASLKVVDILSFQGKDVTMLPWYQRRHLIKMIFDYFYFTSMPTLNHTLISQDSSGNYINDGFLRMTNYAMIDYADFIDSYINPYLSHPKSYIGYFTFHDYNQKYIDSNYELMSSWRSVELSF